MMRRSSGTEMLEAFVGCAWISSAKLGPQRLGPSFQNLAERHSRQMLIARQVGTYRRASAS